MQCKRKRKQEKYGRDVCESVWARIKQPTRYEMGRQKVGNGERIQVGQHENKSQEGKEQLMQVGQHEKKKKTGNGELIHVGQQERIGKKEERNDSASWERDQWHDE